VLSTCSVTCGLVSEGVYCSAHSALFQRTCQPVLSFFFSISLALLNIIAKTGYENSEIESVDSRILFACHCGSLFGKISGILFCLKKCDRNALKTPGKPHLISLHRLTQLLIKFYSNKGDRNPKIYCKGIRTTLKYC